jgi:DNA polymerase-3 subunit beta
MERGNLLLVARLMEGNYPNYQQVIPKDNNRKASVKKMAFQGALRRVSILSREKTNAVRLTVGKGRMLLSSNNPEMGEAHEEMEARCPGEEITTGFNARYLLDVLEAHEGDEVVLEFKDPLSPCLIREDEKKYLCVVMPMRV